MENCLTKFPTGFRGLEKFLLPAASDIATAKQLRHSLSKLERERGRGREDTQRDMGEVRIKRKRRCFDINERVKVGAN